MQEQVSERGIRMRRLILFTVLLTSPATVRAEWREAVSNNFVIVSQDDEKALRQRIAGLERFGLVLQAMTGAQRVKSPPTKIKVYFVDTIDDVQETMPYPAAGIAGYYDTTIRGSFAVMPRVDTGRQTSDLASRVIMQHELTHHFTFQYFPAAYPSWYSEGFADYVGAITITPDGVALIGTTREDRITELHYVNWMPVSKLLVAKSYADVGDNILALYAEGWLLVHFLNDSPDRKAQLNAYLMAINAGESYAEAAKAFGDLKKLDSSLHIYSSRLSLRATQIHYKNIDIGPITVRTLPPDEAALVHADISLNSGIARSKIADFVNDVRAVAARFPSSVYALHILTEAERRSGNIAEASAAADRWLSAAPNDPLAMLNRAQLDIAVLAAAKSTDANAFKAARSKIGAAMKIAPDEPRVLKGFYDSYVAQGVFPPQPAQDALIRAFELLPQEDKLRLQLARDLEAHNNIEDAIFVIRPLAFQIHSDAELGEKKKAARDRLKAKYPIAGEDYGANDDQAPLELLARLEKKKAGQKGDSATPPDVKPTSPHG